VEVEDEELLVGGEVAALHVGPEVVEPPQPAALARPLQPGGAGEGVPAALAVVGDVVDEGEVLVDGPRAAPELQLLLLILRRPSGLPVVVVELSKSPRGARPAPAPAPLGFGHARC